MDQPQDSTTDQSRITNSMTTQSNSKSPIVHRSENNSRSTNTSVFNGSSNQSVGDSSSSKHLDDKRPKTSRYNHCQQQTLTFDDLGDCSSSIEMNFSATTNNRSTVDDDYDIADPVMNESRQTNESISNDMYLDKIKTLSLKVHQQSLIIKEKDLLIKQLRSTTIRTDSTSIICLMPHLFLFRNASRSSNS